MAVPLVLLADDAESKRLWVHGDVWADESVETDAKWRRRCIDRIRFPAVSELRFDCPIGFIRSWLLLLIGLIRRGFDLRRGLGLFDWSYDLRVLRTLLKPLLDFLQFAANPSVLIKKIVNIF